MSTPIFFAIPKDNTPEQIDISAFGDTAGTVIMTNRPEKSFSPFTGEELENINRGDTPRIDMASIESAVKIGTCTGKDCACDQYAHYSDVSMLVTQDVKTLHCVACGGNYDVDVSAIDYISADSEIEAKDNTMKDSATIIDNEEDEDILNDEDIGIPGEEDDTELDLDADNDVNLEEIDAESEVEETEEADSENTDEDNLDAGPDDEVSFEDEDDEEYESEEEEDDEDEFTDVTSEFEVDIEDEDENLPLEAVDQASVLATVKKLENAEGDEAGIENIPPEEKEKAGTENNPAQVENPAESSPKDVAEVEAEIETKEEAPVMDVEVLAGVEEDGENTITTPIDGSLEKSLANIECVIDENATKYFVFANDKPIGQLKRSAAHSDNASIFDKPAFAKAFIMQYKRGSDTARFGYVPYAVRTDVSKLVENITQTKAKEAIDTASSNFDNRLDRIRENLGVVFLATLKGITDNPLRDKLVQNLDSAGFEGGEGIVNRVMRDVGSDFFSNILKEAVILADKPAGVIEMFKETVERANYSLKTDTSSLAIGGRVVRDSKPENKTSDNKDIASEKKKPINMDRFFG